MRTQPLVVVFMAYGTWVAVKCPCRKTLSCHLDHFFLSVGTASALVAWENYVG